MSLGQVTSADRASLTADADPTKPTATARDIDRQHGRSPSQIAWDRLKGDKIAVTSLGIVVFFVLVAVFAPLLVKLEGEELNVYHSDLISAMDTYPIIGANTAHWFGWSPVPDVTSLPSGLMAHVRR